MPFWNAIGPLNFDDGKTTAPAPVVRKWYNFLNVRNVANPVGTVGSATNQTAVTSEDSMACWKPGGTPYMSNTFTQYWKVGKVLKKVLRPGEVWRIKTKWKKPKYRRPVHWMNSLFPWAGPAGVIPQDLVTGQLGGPSGGTVDRASTFEDYYQAPKGFPVWFICTTGTATSATADTALANIDLTSDTPQIATSAHLCEVICKREVQCMFPNQYDGSKALQRTTMWTDRSFQAGAGTGLSTNLDKANQVQFTPYQISKIAGLDD